MLERAAAPASLVAVIAICGEPTHQGRGACVGVIGPQCLEANSRPNHVGVRPGVPVCQTLPARRMGGVIQEFPPPLDGVRPCALRCGTGRLSLTTTKHQGLSRIGRVACCAETKARAGDAPLRGRRWLLLRGCQLASCTVARLLSQALSRYGRAMGLVLLRSNFGIADSRRHRPRAPVQEKSRRAWRRRGRWGSIGGRRRLRAR